MSNRDKIILVVMLLTVGYALHEWMPTPGADRTPTEPESRPAEMKDLQNTVGRIVEKGTLSPEQSLVLTRAQSRWKSDPFLGRKPVPQGQAPKPGIAVDPNGPAYTGYVEVGDKRLAIIDGKQYEVGEELESGAYTVLQIEPEQVVLLHRDDKELVMLPFTGDVY